MGKSFIATFLLISCLIFSSRIFPQTAEIFLKTGHAERYAVRFNQELRRLTPRSEFEEDLKPSPIAETLFSPPPILNLEPAPPPTSSSKMDYWFWSACLSLLGAVLVFWLLKKPNDAVGDLAKRFFYAAGFKKLQQISEQLLLLSPTNIESGGLVYLCRDELAIAEGRISKIIEPFQRKFNRRLKLYLIYRHRGELLKKFALNGGLDCTTIPVHVSTLIQPNYTSACRQKLRELEKPYLAQLDPYRENEPIQDGNCFFGRSELLHRLPNLLAGRNHVGIFGLPKVGKTSLLIQLRQVLKNTPTVLLECQSYQLNAEVFFEQILRQLYAQLAVLEVERLPGKTAVYGKPFARSVSVLASHWRRSGRGEPFVLMIDGVDHFVRAMNGEGGEKVAAEYQRFFGEVKELADRLRDLALVVSADDAEATRLPRLPGENANPLFRFLQEEWLGLLSAHQTASLLRELGWRRSIKWRAEALERVYHYGGGHPWVTRSFASVATRQGELRDIDAADVEIAAQHIQTSWPKYEIGRYIENEWWPALAADKKELLARVAQHNGSGFPKRSLAPRSSSTYRDLESCGVLANDLGRLSVVGEFFRFFLSKKVPTLP